MIINQQNLEKAGYKWYSNNRQNITASYQKRFDAENGKKYFVHVDCWDFSAYGKNCLECSAHAQFVTDKDETFNIGYFVTDTTTVEEMEAFFKKLWNAMNCKYYELF